MERNDNISMAESYLNQVSRTVNNAISELEKNNYDKSIRESQEAIEFAIKTIFYIFNLKPPKEHGFTEEDFLKLREKLQKVNPSFFKDLYIYSRFWKTFYGIAKYGLEKLGVGPGNLFEEDEAKLALKHAERCHIASVTIFSKKVSKP